MKFTEEAIEEATRSYVDGGMWKEIYENAPEGAKKRLRVAFWASRHLEEGEDLDAYRIRRQEIENHEMTVEDAAYLAEKFPPKHDGKRHYMELRNNLILAPLRTDAKLDDAMEKLVEDWSKSDRVLFERTRTIYRTCEDDFGIYTYVELWKAVGGNGDSCDTLADLFNHGHGVIPDEELAVFWWRRGAMANDEKCLLYLAKKLSDPDSGSYDMPEALFWFMEGVRRNMMTVKRELGRRLAFGGEGWEDHLNPKLAFSLLSACKDADKSGLTYYYLGQCFEKGIGIDIEADAAHVLATSSYLLGKLKGCELAEEAYARLTFPEKKKTA